MREVKCRSRRNGVAAEAQLIARDRFAANLRPGFQAGWDLTGDLQMDRPRQGRCAINVIQCDPYRWVALPLRMYAGAASDCPACTIAVRRIVADFGVR